VNSGDFVFWWRNAPTPPDNPNLTPGPTPKARGVISFNLDTCTSAISTAPFSLRPFSCFIRYWTLAIQVILLFATMPHLIGMATDPADKAFFTKP